MMGIQKTVLSVFYSTYAQLNRKATIYACREGDRKYMMVECVEDGLLYLLKAFDDKSIRYLEDLCENFVEAIGEFKKGA